MSAVQVVGPEPQGVMCSFSECEKGHRWVPTLGLAKCPGCQAPVLMVQMVNCPYCNEPTVRQSFRADHIGYKGQLVAMCKGFGSAADVTQIEFEREHWRVCEENVIPVGLQPATIRQEAHGQE